MKRWRRLLWGVAAGLVISAAGPAAAQQRVAVLSFSGPRGSQARSALVRQLSDDYEIVDAREWTRTASRIRSKGRSARAVARVAEELGVTAIVDGGVNRARRRWSVSARVRDGADGRTIGRRARSIRNLGGAATAGAQLARTIRDLIDEAEGAGPSEEREETQPEDSPPERVDPPRYEDEEPPRYEEEEPRRYEEEEPRRYEEEEPRRYEEEPRRYEDVEDERPPLFGGRGGGGQARDDEPVPEEVPSLGRRERGGRGRSGASRGSGHGWLDLALQMIIATRDFAVPIDPLVDMGARDEAQFYSSQYPELGLRLSFYPGALFTDNWASGFGVEGSFHHHIYLKVFNTRQAREVDSSEYAFTVGGTYRAALGTADRGATLWARAGYGRFSFYLGDLANDIVPPFVYDYIYIVLAGHIPLGTRHAGIDLGGGYLAVLSIGDAAMRAYNASGQLPTSHGFQVDAGLSGQIWRGLRWGVGFELLGFHTVHVGLGEGFGSDPTTVASLGGRGIKTTGPSLDIHWRLVFQLAYRFGWSPEPAGDRSRDRGGGREGEGWDEPEGDGFEDDWDDGEWS